jgi:hypothetical protein
LQGGLTVTVAQINFTIKRETHMKEAAKLELGTVVATPAAMTLAAKVAGNAHAGLMLLNGLLDRYKAGDWGVLDAEDVAQNDAACSADDPQRVLANYPITGGDGSVRDEGRIWIITEWDRSVTTFLLPDDY